MSVNETIRIRFLLINLCLHRLVQLCDNARLKLGSHLAFIRTAGANAPSCHSPKYRWINQLPIGASWTAEY